MKNSADQGWLEFINSEAVEGFTAKAVAADNETNPDIIVRELIQNSLDAGRLAGREKTEVVFVFDHIARDQIPGLKKYKKAFDAARQVHGEGGVAEQAQIERISKSLDQSHIPVLHIFDNGIGLDKHRMHSLLADGATDKHGEASGSAGSYGLGHFTAFPASDMHYILYGGVTVDGKKTMSAHAILASHEMDDKPKGKDGYYITGRRKKKNAKESNYNFPSNDEIHPYMRKHLERIQSQHGTGSVVSILSFNNFRDDSGDDNAVQSIINAAARHFFPAIHQGRLEVRVKRNNEEKEKTLNKNILHKILRGLRTERRLATKDNLINGSKAYAAYRTLCDGKLSIIETKLGRVDLYFRTADSDERTSISLFRSGMYICDQLPRNTLSVYQTYKPFNAVLLVYPPRDKQETDEAFQLIRGAEGEKHATIIKNRLQECDRGNFDQLFKDIQATIKKTATEDTSDAFSPDTFMLLTLTPDKTSPSKRARKKSDNRQPELHLPYTPVSEHISDRSDSEGVNDGPPKPGPNPKPRPLNPKPNPVDPVPSFQRSGRRAEARVGARRSQSQVRLLLQPEEPIENAGLRFILDRGADPSCTDPLPSKFMALKSDAVVEGKRVSEASCRKDKDGKIYEILLGSLQKDQRYEVSVNFEKNIPANAILKVDLMSRESKEASA